MADFKEHLGWALGGGVILAIAALHNHHLQPLEGIAVVGLAGIGGSIPDIDHNKTKKDSEEYTDIGSKPFRYFTFFLSAVMPIVILYHLNHRLGKNLWINIFLYFLLSTVIYKTVPKLITDNTTHRGVMHSIPFAFLCSELTYLIFLSDYDLLASSSKKMPIYFATAIFVGYLSHLIADEIHTLKWDEVEKKIVGNQYSKTAFVFYSDKYSTDRANFILYFLVIVLFFTIKSGEVSLQSLLALLFTFD